MSNILTLARRAIWDSIENYVETAGYFNQKYRMDDEGLPELVDDNPTFGDLPAIMVSPLEESPEWFTNRDQMIPMGFEVKIWTEQWNYETAEILIYKVRKALWKASPAGSSQTYIEIAGCGYMPVGVGKPITYKPVKLGASGRFKAIRTTMIVMLHAKDDPRE